MEEKAKPKQFSAYHLLQLWGLVEVIVMLNFSQLNFSASGFSMRLDILIMVSS